MPVYIVAEVEVTEPVEYKKYVELVTPTLGHYGGRYLARGGETQSLEGAPPAGRMVIAEFPSLAQARAWWTSEEYAPIKAIRNRTAKSRVIMLAGLEPAADSAKKGDKQQAALTTPGLARPLGDEQRVHVE